MRLLRSKHQINVALQGGGAHGAFTWGVLERLLDHSDIRIAALSGSSAGALNAAVFASGMANGGRDGAAAALAAFWESTNGTVRDSGPLIPIIEAFPIAAEAAMTWWSIICGNLPFPSTPELGRPAQDTLRRLLVDHVDFAALRSKNAPRLFISATNARTGDARIFRNEEITVDALLASACLPLIVPPVKIDDCEYWDGGYSANPPIMPLVLETSNNDLLLVTINPMSRDETPTSAQDITARITELGFNQAMVKDLRSIDLVQQAASPQVFPRGVLRRVAHLRLHEIHDEPTLTALHPSSKMLPVWQVLSHLHTAGKDAAQQWITDNAAKLGKASTIDLAERYRQ